MLQGAGNDSHSSPSHTKGAKRNVSSTNCVNLLRDDTAHVNIRQDIANKQERHTLCLQSKQERL